MQGRRGDGGAERGRDIPHGAREVEVDLSSKLLVVREHRAPQIHHTQKGVRLATAWVNINGAVGEWVHPRMRCVLGGRQVVRDPGEEARGVEEEAAGVEGGAAGEGGDGVVDGWC